MSNAMFSLCNVAWCRIVEQAQLAPIPTSSPPSPIVKKTSSSSLLVRLAASINAFFVSLFASLGSRKRLALENDTVSRLSSTVVVLGSGWNLERGTDAILRTYLQFESTEASVYLSP